MKPTPLTYALKSFGILSIIAVSLLLTPQHVRAQGATGGTYAAGLIVQPAQGIATSPDQAAFGVGADASAGTNSTAIGGLAIASGVNSTTVGNFSFAKGLNATTLGYSAGTNAATAGVTSVGTFTNGLVAGIYSSALGAGASFATAPNSLGAYSIAVGGGDGVGGTGAVASGASSIAIGLSSVASGLSSTAIGGTGVATRPTIAAAGFSTALGTGDQINAGATGATAVGDFNTVNAGGIFGTTVGNFNTVGGASATAIGSGNTANGANSVALGVGDTASGASSIAIGSGATASNTNAIAMGTGATAGFSGSAAFGAGATATRANQQVFGTAANTYTMPGITSASSLANQTGATQFVTSDAGGNLATAGFGPSSIIALSNRVDLLGNRINNVRNEERGGVALAIATGQIRYDDQPGKVSVGGGIGAFEDQGGAALGIGFTSPGGRVRGNISGGGSFHGEWGGGAGLSITLN